jgi:methylenetetrahydrofolate dehydrogenase (NADP+)/methenyltetrahydrofolate cyclohydrolase
MAAQIIDGKAIAAEVRQAVARDVEEFAERFGARPGLATILVGDDPGSAVYVAGKQKASAEVGMEPSNYPLPADTPREDLVALIERLNDDSSVDGILLQLPLPAHLDGVEMTGMIDADKDVDGLTPVSAGRLTLGIEGLRPCTPQGVMALLASTGAQLEGAEAVVIGRSNLFGKPMVQLLLEANATVTTCHSRTKDLPAVCRRADVLIAAVGRARMVKADWIKPGAIVIDVGMNRTEDGLAGDVDFDAVKEVASAITPVPGGVGPMTIAFLLRNTLQAARMARARGAAI